MLIFTSFYLESCIRPNAISQWIRQGNSITFVQISEEVQRRPWKLLCRRSGKKAWAVHGKSKLTETEKGETGEGQSQEHVHHIFDIKELLTKNSYWQAKQSIPHITATFYGDCVKNVQRFRSELWRQNNWLLLHDNEPSHTSFLNREFFAKNITAVPHPTYSPDLDPCDFCLFPAILTQSSWFRDRITGDAVHPHSTRLPRCI
jgi:hypothetical protein